jgi:hypothetical protein
VSPRAARSGGIRHAQSVGTLSAARCHQCRVGRALMRENGRHAHHLRPKVTPWIGCDCGKGTVWVPTTAKTLGIGIPQTLLTAADEVVDWVCLTFVTGTFRT